MATARRRRSSFFPHHNESLNETPYIDDENVDEETERKNRMKLQKRQSIGHGHSAPPPATPNADNNAGSIARYALLFSECKTESFIKKCNAFLSYPIIENCHFYVLF